VTRPDPELARFRYPEDWPEVAGDVRERAGGRCECRGECQDPFCNSGQQPDRRCKTQDQRHYPPLAVVALDANPSNAGTLGDRPNLRAFCQACADGLRYGLRRADPRRAPTDRRPAHQATLDL